MIDTRKFCERCVFGSGDHAEWCPEARDMACYEGMRSYAENNQVFWNLVRSKYAPDVR